MKLIFLVLTFLYFFPIPAHAAWIYLPDTLMNSPSDGMRYTDVNGVSYTTLFSTQPISNGGFVIDALNPANPLPINTVGLVIPPLAPAMLASGGTPPQDWFTLFSGTVAAKMFSTAFFLVSVSGIAGYYMGVLIKMLGFRRY